MIDIIVATNQSGIERQAIDLKISSCAQIIQKVSCTLHWTHPNIISLYAANDCSIKTVIGDLVWQPYYQLQE